MLWLTGGLSVSRCMLGEGMLGKALAQQPAASV